MMRVSDDLQRLNRPCGESLAQRSYMEKAVCVRVVWGAATQKVELSWTRSGRTATGYVEFTRNVRSKVKIGKMRTG